MRSYSIKGNIAKAYNPKQKSPELSMQDIKREAKILMGRTNADRREWFTAIRYFFYMSKRRTNKVKDCETSMKIAFGEIPDIYGLFEL